MDHLAPSGVNWYSFKPFGELLGGSQLPPVEIGGLDVGRQLAPQVQYAATQQLAVNSGVNYVQDYQSVNLVEDLHVSQEEEEDLISSGEPKASNRVRSALGEKITCQECGATFACGANLRNHLRIHTGERPYICEECGASFTQRSNLRSHMRVHTGERPYMCGICGQTFARSSHLPGHMRTHTGEKPFSCPHCGRSFGTNQILKNHMRTHTGERPFICEVCDATFAQSSCLATHKKIHTGERNFKCDRCGKAFISRSGLQTHERVHTGEKPFTCGKCDKSFKTSSYLSKHKQKYCGNNGYKNRSERPRLKKPDQKLSKVRKMGKSVVGAKTTVKSPKKLGTRRLRRSGRNRMSDADMEVTDDMDNLALNKELSVSSSFRGKTDVKHEGSEVYNRNNVYANAEMVSNVLGNCRSQENQDPLGVHYKDENYYIGASDSGNVHQDVKQRENHQYHIPEQDFQINLGELGIDLEEQVPDVF